MKTLPNIYLSSQGKTRWPTIIILIIGLQCIVYGSLAITVYSIITWNVPLILFLLCLSIVQSFVGRSNTYIKLVNRFIKPLNYFKSFTRIYEQRISQQDPSIFCFHPHSVFSYCKKMGYLGISSNMNADESKMSKMKGLASRVLLSGPFVGLILKLWGISSVNSKNLRKLMSKKETLGIVPGGYEEATLTTPKQIRIFINERKGFIKYALTYGYTIYPTITFNEHKAFSTFDGFKKFRLFLNKIKIPSVIFGNGFLWFFLPTNIDLITVVGKGLKRKPDNLDKDISNQEIQQLHGQYIKQIKRIHKKYNKKYGPVRLMIY